MVSKQEEIGSYLAFLFYPRETKRMKKRKEEKRNMGGVIGKKSNARQPQMLNKLITESGSSGISQWALGEPLGR